MTNDSKEIKPAYWFPAKRYGWGWGAPITWQGWLVILAYLALLLGGALRFQAVTDPAPYSIYVAVLTALLVAICWLKGEPPRWRWGDKK
ncbi:MAG: hypothetical protein V4724_11800 [Pseudomonadota bacterium]